MVSTEVELTTAKKKVLLAEDDLLTAAVVKRRLGKEGIEVLHFTDGAAALSAALDTPFSLALLGAARP